MSAGRFTRRRYAAVYDDTAIHPIRVQPETLLLTIGGTANTAPTGAVTNPISAVVSRGVRSLGLRPATVTLQWIGSEASDEGNIGSTTVPLLNATIRTAASTADDATAVSYLGSTNWRVAGYTEEEAK